MAILITQSLVSAWNYAMNAREECQEEAYLDFLSTLRREPREASPEMQNGIAFEKLVYCIATDQVTGETDKWRHGAWLVADIIKGAAIQVKAQRELKCHGYDLLVFGIMDALKAGTIYDVKFSNRSFGSVDLAGKYLDSPQHPAYFYIAPEAREFRYLVSDGEDLYVERYAPRETRPFAQIADEFLTFLESAGLIDEYVAKWGTRV